MASKAHFDVDVPDILRPGRLPKYYSTKILKAWRDSSREFGNAISNSEYAKAPVDTGALRGSYSTIVNGKVIRTKLGKSKALLKNGSAGRLINNKGTYRVSGAKAGSVATEFGFNKARVSARNDMYMHTAWANATPYGAKMDAGGWEGRPRTKINNGEAQFIAKTYARGKDDFEKNFLLRAKIALATPLRK